VCNLQRKDIDFDRKTVFVKKQKGNYDRYVPLSDILARGLKKYFKTENPYKWVFNPKNSWYFVMKSQNVNKIGKRRGFLQKELSPNFEGNKLTPKNSL